MAVCPGESLLTLAAEMPTGMTSTAAVRTTNARGDESRAAWSAVRRHRNRATVNHWGNNKDRVIKNPFGTTQTTHMNGRLHDKSQQCLKMKECAISKGYAAGKTES